MPYGLGEGQPRWQPRAATLAVYRTHTRTHAHAHTRTHTHAHTQNDPDP